MTNEQRKKKYLEYLAMKIVEQDWHGVADCAMDLRELEVQLKFPKRQKTKSNRQTRGYE